MIQILKTLSYAICLYGLVVLLVYLFQRRLMYQPDMEKPLPVQWGVPEMQEIKLQTEDGLSLLSWYKPAAEKAPTIVYFHGNAGHIGTRGQRLRYFIEKGYGLFMLSYRGYGLNPGAPTENGLYLDAKAAMDFLQSKGIALNCIVIFGESLGTGVAVEMAMRYKPGALVLQSPYTTMADAAQFNYPYLPAKWLVIDKYESMQKIPHVETPIIIFHGTEDDVVPSYMGEALYRAAKSQKQLKLYDGYKHDDILMEESASAINNFLNLHIRC